MRQEDDNPEWRPSEEGLAHNRLVLSASGDSERLRGFFDVCSKLSCLVSGAQD